MPHTSTGTVVLHLRDGQVWTLNDVVSFEVDAIRSGWLGAIGEVKIRARCLGGDAGFEIPGGWVTSIDGDLEGLSGEYKAQVNALLAQCPPC